MIINNISKLITSPIIELLIASVGVLILHQNIISNFLNYIIIGYIFVILTICSTISLIKESVIVIKEYLNFIYFNLLLFIFINLFLIIFLGTVFISNNNINIVIFLMTFFSLIISFFTSIYGIRKIIIYKSQNFEENEQLLN